MNHSHDPHDHASGHHKHHHHNHHHHDHHARATGISDDQVRSAMTKVLLMTAVFMCVEATAGFWTGSLALLGDSAHMLTDVGALAMALVSFRLSQRPRTPEHTFGLRRVEVVGALANGAFLIVLAMTLIWHAVGRFHEPTEVLSQEMLIVAILGLAVNIVAGFILMRGSHSNLAMKGAYLHVLGDAVSSVGAIVAALLIQFQGWLWADAAASVMVAVIILVAASGFLRETLRVLLQGTPLGIDTSQVEGALQAVNGVAGVRDLHLWALSLGFPILTVHIVKKSRDHEELLEEIHQLLREKFGIKHATVQISSRDHLHHCHLE